MTIIHIDAPREPQPPRDPERDELAYLLKSKDLSRPAFKAIATAMGTYSGRVASWCGSCSPVPPPFRAAFIEELRKLPDRDPGLPHRRFGC